MPDHPELDIGALRAILAQAGVDLESRLSVLMHL